MNAMDIRMLARIPIPAMPIIDQAIEFARQKCEPYLFNHVVRSSLFAVRIGQFQGIEHDADSLFETSLKRNLISRPYKAVIKLGQFTYRIFDAPQYGSL